VFSKQNSRWRASSFASSCLSLVSLFFRPSSFCECRLCVCFFVMSVSVRASLSLYWYVCERVFYVRAASVRACVCAYALVHGRVYLCVRVCLCVCRSAICVLCVCACVLYEKAACTAASSSSELPAYHLFASCNAWLKLCLYVCVRVCVCVCLRACVCA